MSDDRQTDFSKMSLEELETLPDAQELAATAMPVAPPRKPPEDAPGKENIFGRLAKLATEAGDQARDVDAEIAARQSDDVKPPATDPPMTRNADARKRADADPVAVLDHAAGTGWPMLSEALNKWDWEALIPFDEHGQPMTEQDANYEAVVAAYEAAAAAQTPEWRALEIRDLMYMKRQGDYMPRQGDGRVEHHLGRVLIEHLAVMPEAPGSTFGLSLLTALVAAIPPLVETDKRVDRRIMPVLRVIEPPPERVRGMLFGGLVDDREVDLPLFPELEPARHRVPLLEIVDAAGVPLRSAGKGAPIEARLIVRGGLLMIRPADRHLETVRIAVTVKELIDGLYPPIRRRRLAENWPKVERALRVARDYTISDATGGRWFPIALRRLPAMNPDGTPALDDLIVLDLAPPPGAGAGSSLALPELDLMGLSNGPRWRAYIAGRSLVWVPGTTRRPVPGKAKGKPRRWGWSAAPEDYPVLILGDLRRLAFGDGDNKNRTRTEIKKPWENLPDLVMVPDQTDAHTGIRGYRLLPSEARSALRRMRGSGGRNRGVTQPGSGVTQPGSRVTQPGSGVTQPGSRSDATGENRCRNSLLINKRPSARRARAHQTDTE